MQELPFHRIDLGEICCDVVITATLPGHQAEAAARECRRWTCAAQMNYRGQLLPLLTADPRVSTMAEDRCDFAVQEHRGELGGVALHDPRMAQGRGTAGLNDGMVENPITLSLRQRGVGHLIHADSARRRETRKHRASDLTGTSSGKGQHLPPQPTFEATQLTDRLGWFVDIRTRFSARAK